jgi:hypothetical protein
MAGYQPTAEAELSGTPLLLLDSPWSVRFGRGTRGRPALEIYNSGLLLDVLVAKPLAADVLRGARRGERNGRASVLVWGHLPADTVPPGVVLSQRHLEPCAPEPVALAGLFWVALAEGRYDRAAATRPDGRTERLRVRAGWSR